MFNFFQSYSLLIIIVVLELIALTCLKTYNINNKKIYFAIAIIFYAILCYFAKELFKIKAISVSVSIWSALSITLSTLLSIYYFKERKHIMVFVGIAVVLIGIIIIDNYDHL